MPQPQPSSDPQQYPHGYYPPLAPLPRRPVWDVVVSWALTLSLLAVAGLGFLYSMFAMMATDVCSQPGRCADSLIGMAYLSAWGGIGTALLVTLVGMKVAATRRRIVAVWPLLGWVIFLATYIAAGYLLNAGVGG